MFVVDVIIIFLLIFLVVFFIFLISGMYMEDEFMSMYECGFDSACEVRFVFSYRFFILAMLFIVFDVEVALLLPVLYVSDSLILMIIYGSFMLVLFAGTFYEVLIGSMDWV